MTALRDRIRRTITVSVALVLAAILLRGQVSSALVTRGDQLAFRGRSERARQLYERALVIDPSNAMAVDRLAFSAIIGHKRGALRSATILLTRFLQQIPADVTLRMDRALCEQGLGELTSAAGDFVEVGTRTRDPRALMFGALDVAPSRRAYGEHLLRLALAADARFTPARRALARLVSIAP